MTSAEEVIMNELQNYYFEWKEVADNTYRMKVPGGYLYRYDYYSNSTIVFAPGDI